jgi:hypothetical protein
VPIADKEHELMTTADMNHFARENAQEADRLDAEALEADQRAAKFRALADGAEPGVREQYLLDVAAAEYVASHKRTGVVDCRSVVAAWAREAKVRAA